MIDQDDEANLNIIMELLKGGGSTDRRALETINQVLQGWQFKYGDNVTIAKIISRLSSCSKILFSEGRHRAYPGGVDGIRSILLADLMTLWRTLNRP